MAETFTKEQVKNLIEISYKNGFEQGVNYTFEVVGAVENSNLKALEKELEG